MRMTARAAIRAVALSLLSLLGLLGLQGCSMVTLGYGHLDTFTLYMVRDYIQPEPGVQYNEARSAVQRLHQAAQMRHVAAWVEAWHALDAQLLAPLANAPHAQLVLCGTRHACVVQSEASAWPSWWRAWRAPTLQQALLDR